MPQVDVEVTVTSCSGASDGKIICETLTDDNLDDFPPESFWLSKDAEFDWCDRNAFYERKESTKGNSNSSNLNPGSNSSSQRFSVNLKSKASILGLPKTQKATYGDSWRKSCKPANIRLFPKRPNTIGKSTSMAEPSSPKVSCMGKVRSKRCRRRSNSLKKRDEKTRTGSEKKKAGFCSKLMSMFRFKPGNKTNPVRSKSRRAEEPKPLVEPLRKSVKVRDLPMTVEPALAEPPNLGEMMRFASGRRSESWSFEGDVHRR